MNNSYYHTPESVKEYITLAKDVSGAQLIAKLKGFLKAGANILEIGSGPGTDWNLLDQDYQVTGSDLSKEFLKHLRVENPSATFLELDAATLQTDSTFDGIYSNKVLHHLTDEQLVASLKRQFELLEKGGIICHSFWKGEGDEVFKGMFVNYHTEKELSELFKGYFEPLLLTEYEEFEVGDSVILIAKKLG